MTRQNGTPSAGIRAVNHKLVRIIVPEALKEMYNRAYLDDLAVAISDFYPPFDGEAFSAGIFDGGWEEQALKERMRHITLTLRPLLPGS